MTLGEISQMLKSRFSSYKKDASTFRKLGAALNRPVIPRFPFRRGTKNVERLLSTPRCESRLILVK